MAGMTSTDTQQVLMRLSSLEQFMKKQRHDELAKLIAQQVVEQLKGSINQPPLSTGSRSVVLDGTTDVIRDTDAILQEIHPSPRRSIGSKVPKSSTGATPRTIVTPRSSPTPRSLKDAARPDGDAGPPVASPRDMEPDGDAGPFESDGDILNGKESGDQEGLAPILRRGGSAMAITVDDDDAGHVHEDHQSASRKEKIDKLRRALEFSEHMANTPRRSISSMIAESHTQKKDNVLDAVVSAIIILNAIIIGISLDNDLLFCKIMDVLFTLCFLVELGLKFKIHGIRQHFSNVANCFDFMVIVIDVVQLLLDKILQTEVMKNTPAASVFRVMRLARLTRLIRLGRLRMFDELVAMITGMVGGMTTLLWSMVFFGLIAYITALLFREFYGNDEFEFRGEDIRSYFESVPRAMYTTFRFFFGDFTAASGVSLFEAIRFKYGGINSIFVALLFFVITIGLFNVIAAIFVESTLAAAYATQMERKGERMNDDRLWGRCISILVEKFFEHCGCEVTEPLSQSLDEFSQFPCEKQMFDLFVNDPSVVKALTSLEIADEDHKYLFDILDSDNTGEIMVSELSDGVERLRGEPRRSDIICVDLMVRSIQEQANYLCRASRQKLDYLSSIQKSVRRIETFLGVATPKGKSSGSLMATLNERRL